MFDLKDLWGQAKLHWLTKRAAEDSKYGRCMGKHIVTKVQRARAKRIAAGKKPYMPA